MKQTTLVLIHGGQHSKLCWNPTIKAINSLASFENVLAINLPGHGDDQDKLATLTIKHCVDDVTSQILATSPTNVVLIGHSLAGITIPGVAEKLGKPLVKKIIFIACCIPPDGKRVIDTLHFPMSLVAKFAAKKSAISPAIPTALASWVFANGMTKQQKQLVFNDLRPESTRVVTEAVDRSNFPKIPMDWVITKRDRAINPKLQRKFIENLGGVDNIVGIDTCHDAMISEPEKLARIIINLAR